MSSDVQTLQDEMEAIVLNEETIPINSDTLEKNIGPKYPDKPSQVLFPENDGSLESLLLMLKVPPTQDVFQLIVQNAMGNDLPVSQKVFLSLENNGYTSNVNFPSTAYNHLNNKPFENQYIATTPNSNATGTTTRGVLSSENSNKIIIQNHYSTDEMNKDPGNVFQNYRFGNDHEANANHYFPQCRNKEDRQRLQQYQKQKRRASTDFMDLVSQVPYWVDWDKIQKGQAVFWKYGLPLWISTTLYAMTKGAILPLPDPLNSSSRLSREADSKSTKKEKKQGIQLLPSYLETSQIIIESMMENSLRPGGVAWKSLIQIRCRHAQFRVDYVDTSFDLQELHDYLEDGIKYYEKRNKKKGKSKESYELDADGNLQLVSKTKPEVKSDVKIIEFVYPNQNGNGDQLLITGTAHHNDRGKKRNEDELEIDMIKSQTNTVKRKSKSGQSKALKSYPTPSTSPTPNQQKLKKRNVIVKPTTPTMEEKLPPIQKEVMALPTELLDSIFPINQISLAKTILYLSIGSVKAMERTFGISMSKEEQENYLLVWRYIAWICGLEDKRGKNYGNKIITPKYAEIAINYFLEKDPLVSWDDELVYHAQAVINSLALTIPIVGMTPFIKSIVNEVSRKFTYFTSMPISKEVPYSITITLPNHHIKVFTLPFLSYLMHWVVNPMKKVEEETEYDSSFDNIKKQYGKKNPNRNFDGRSSKGKSRFREESTTSISSSSSSQTYNRYKKKIERNMDIIHGQKSLISSSFASIFLAVIRFINNIFGFTGIGVYLMNRINQALLPKLIWIANNYQWVDFSRRKLT
ncbi:hypothetical protein PIROE2DRAFT_16810 [Piromyces sp. E2]|nr:hypothetical protein PIROE2DRAFT_16810 [Piromyces sp. E2]|eukprot:OUM58032.1 hypothetical protein PIROE2DRAFT_16810 [Piromyces sp. E2]